MRVVVRVFLMLTPFSDDPFNQTAADNAEWLRRFKREVGILTDPSLPGLPEGLQWNIAQGGSGFAPPYAFPNPNVPLAPFDDTLTISMLENTKPIATESTTANKYLQTFATRQTPPAAVFCARELEAGLAQFVTDEVSLLSCGGGQAARNAAFPSDEVIRAKARDILKTPTTAADDPVLLEKFKEMMKQRLQLDEHSPLDFGAQSTQSQAPSQNQSPDHMTGLELLSPTSGMDLSSANLDLTMTEAELNNILVDINFDFGDIPGLTEEETSKMLGDLNQL